jgi:hypothetical protein
MLTRMRQVPKGNAAYGPASSIDLAVWAPGAPVRNCALRGGDGWIFAATIGIHCPLLVLDVSGAQCSA